MRLSRKTLSLFFAVLYSVGILALVSACDSGGVTPPEDDPPENDSISVAVSAVDPDGSQITEAVGYLNDDKVSESGEINTKLEQAERDFSIRFESSGLITVDTTLSQGEDHEFDMVMREDTPETVTKTLSATAAESDTAIAVDFYNDSADTLLAENVTEVTVQFPYQEQPVSVRAEREYFQAERRSVSLSEDGEVPAFALQRESVSIQLLLETMANEPDLSEATIKVYEPAKKDSVSCTGRECMKNLPKRSGQRSVRITNRDTHPQTGDIRRYDPYTETFAADEDRSLSAELSALAACNDDINNETGPGDDGLVDVWEDSNGNGIPDEGDIGDPGCRNPQDDNEGHRFLTLVTTQFNRDLRISSVEGENEILIDDNTSNNPLPASADDAIGDYVVTQENFRTPEDTGEAYYLRFNTGPEDELGNVNSTQTIPDADTIDGWHDAQAYGVDASFWGDKNYYTITAVYDGPPNADADIRFLFEDGEGRKTVISYLYEEEDYDGSSNAKASRQEAGTECRTTDGLRVCETVGFRSYLEP